MIEDVLLPYKFTEIHFQIAVHYVREFFTLINVFLFIGIERKTECDLIELNRFIED